MSPVSPSEVSLLPLSPRALLPLCHPTHTRTPSLPPFPFTSLSLSRPPAGRGLVDWTAILLIRGSPFGGLPWQPWPMKTGSRQQARLSWRSLWLRRWEVPEATPPSPLSKPGRIVAAVCVFPRVCVSLRVCVCVVGELASSQPAHCTRSQTGYQAGSSTEQPRC